MTADSFTRSYLSGELKEVGFLIYTPDSALKIFGFAVEIVSPEQVSGRFRVTETCCQPFKVLHGGVSALICEGLASMGAHVASGFRRTSGIELNINHLRAAPLGEYIFARAKPVISGRRVQVWEVKLWKVSQQRYSDMEVDFSSLDEKDMVAISRLTLLCGGSVPSQNAKL